MPGRNSGTQDAKPERQKQNRPDKPGGS